MKINELNFTAFGPFTDKPLVFDQEEGVLHIIYGANEAGKSSSLRGLKALLYGIDERTPDNFLHDNNVLRIKGCLQNIEGKKLVFTRRKGRKNTIIGPDGNPLDEQTLLPFLQGVKLELFEALFGIDHMGLQQGGQEILEQKGDVGQTLFSASLGSHSLHKVLEQLDTEAEELFKPRGLNQKINSAIKSYTETKKEIKKISLSSREWDDQRRSLDQVTNDLSKIQFKLKANRREVTRLNRIKRALPKLTRLAELLRELETPADVVILPEDFLKRHQQAVKELDAAKAILGKTTPRFNGLQHDVEQLSVNHDLLDQAETIEDLHARLGGHRKALQDQPHLKAERKQLLIDAEFLLKDVRPDLDLKEIEILRPLLTRQKAITELGNQKALHLSKLHQAESNQRATETRLKTARKNKKKLLKFVSSGALRRAITTARKLGDLDGLIQSTLSETNNLHSQCDEGLSRLTLWDGVLDELPMLALPNKENINHFEQTYDGIDKRFQKFKDKQEEAEKALLEALRSLDKLQRVGNVPTEDDLLKVRSVRDQIWKLLRREWIDKEDVSSEASQLVGDDSLPDTFEERLVDTDELSDRLRREAKRVHAVANLQANEKTLHSKIKKITQGLDACAMEKSQLNVEWNALWADCEIQPRTPREMKVWLDEQEKLVDRIELLNQSTQKSKELEQSRQAQIQLLNEQLEEVGLDASKSEILETVLMECEEQLQNIEDIKQKREELNKDTQRLETEFESISNEHQTAKDELDGWRKEWKTLMKGFGLPGNSMPVELSDIMEKLRMLFEKQKEAENLQIRISAIDKDASSYHKQVFNMIENLAPEFKYLPVDDAILRLNTLLSDNQASRIRYDQLKEQIQHAQNEIEESNSSVKLMTEQLESLAVEAKCNKVAELEEAERNSDEYLRIKREIDSIKQEIIQTGEGSSIADLRAEAEQIDPDELPAQIDELNERIENELEPRRNELSETKGRKQKELELMDGSDRAAVLADQSQATLAGIRADAERYVRAKLAGKVLRDEIERYRIENQGPLVKRASECFAVLTGGSFESLRADFNEKDEPVLVGIRPNEERVSVEGMSSGTRDQLYLALRIASLEKYMEGSEPMPFIVDDILVDFDDDRSKAALIALSELAKQTQVIIFTHHSKVVEQAENINASVNVQEL